MYTWDHSISSTLLAVENGDPNVNILRSMGSTTFYASTNGNEYEMMNDEEVEKMLKEGVYAEYADGTTHTWCMKTIEEQAVIIIDGINVVTHPNAQ
jgi:guanylate kinase